MTFDCSMIMIRPPQHQDTFGFESFVGRNHHGFRLFFVL